MEFSWRYYGVPVGFSWSSHGVLVKFSWSYQSSNSLLSFHAALAVSSQSYYRVLMEWSLRIISFLWGSQRVSWVSHGVLMWFSYEIVIKLSLGSHRVSGFSLSFMMFLQFSHRVFMGCPVPLFIRNNTLPLQTLLSLHSYYGCIVFLFWLVWFVMREWNNLLLK